MVVARTGVASAWRGRVPVSVYSRIAVYTVTAVDQHLHSHSSVSNTLIGTREAVDS